VKNFNMALALLALGPSTALADETVPAVTALEHVTIFVRDQEDALRWYVDNLGMSKVEDRRFGGGERWLTVAPAGKHATHIVLAVPRPEMQASIGHQHNWVFRTGDCRETHRRLTARGVKYLAPPAEVPWGCQAIIEDLYGNRIVLLGPGTARKPGDED
jgi:predicted enzyme related to lactoylglutathione lyase